MYRVSFGCIYHLYVTFQSVFSSYPFSSLLYLARFSILPILLPFSSLSLPFSPFPLTLPRSFTFLHPPPSSPTSQPLEGGSWADVKPKTPFYRLLRDPHPHDELRVRGLPVPPLPSSSLPRHSLPLTQPPCDSSFFPLSPTPLHTIHSYNITPWSFLSPLSPLTIQSFLPHN